ncbi:MAG TPA: zf-HC2 domain-containing protein [Jatrophihabitans sp.]|nr:zf-HC2 domain-containing protein [Jatrophihabitans sp.]
MSSFDDPFRYDDAAYVLGALDAGERAAFEAHFATCPDCQARVAEARAGRDLLAGVQWSDLDEQPPVPDTLLPGLLRSARRERNRRRWLTTSLGAVAAACLIALAVVVWPSGSSTSPGEPFAAVRPSPVAATGKLIAKRWGTEIDVMCRYRVDADRYVPYDLVVIDKFGDKHPAGNWALPEGSEMTFTGGTSVQLSQIDRVQITLTDGTPILQLRA